jgi:hypothetical protein
MEHVEAIGVPPASSGDGMSPPRRQLRPHDGHRTDGGEATGWPPIPGGDFDAAGSVGKLQGMPQDLRDVDPRELRLPSGRSGPDPYKLQRQIARFGASSAGMPPPWVYEASDGVLVVDNGITRASRIAKLAPGTTIRVEVVGKLRRAYGGEPKVGDDVP